MWNKLMKRLSLIPVIASLLLSSCTAQLEAEKKSETDASLEVHFIDVGQADSALLISDDDAMLIDGGNRDDSSLLYSYLSDCDIDSLEYIIGTHAHEDHMGGLLAALNKAEVGKIYIPEADSDADFFKKFIKKAKEKDIEIVAPENGEMFSLGSCDVTLFTPSFIDREELNNTSIMAKITCGEISFLFTGDAERDEELDIIDSGADLSATVLKSGHHGSATSSSYPFLREVMPEIVVISVGADNPYSHPHKEILSRYNDLGAKVYRTDQNGHIIIKTDGENITVEPIKRDNEEGKNPEAARYIGNISSKKLHLSTCANLPKEKNRVYFDTYDDAISVGYSPCGSCLP